MTPEQVEFLAQFIFESDAIEGISDSMPLLIEQIQDNYQSGHVGAILLLDALAETDDPLTEEVICRVQGLITAEQHEKLGGELLDKKWVGKYRDRGVRINRRLAPSHTKVPGLMEELLWGVGKLLNPTEIQQFSRENIIRFIAQIHFIYLFIHPFIDGNGRSSRALAYYFLRKYGIKPFIFSSADRFTTYYQCFKDQKQMERYFVERSKQA